MIPQGCCKNDCVFAKRDVHMFRAFVYLEINVEELKHEI